MMHEAPTAAVRPAWTPRGAAWAGLFVLALPLILLSMAALFAGVVVLGTLALVAKALSWPRRLLPRRDGRENVRVIPQRDA